MDSLIFFGCFIIFLALICFIYIIYFIFAVKWINPLMLKIVKDKDTSDGLFMTVFWFGAGVALVIISLSYYHKIIHWINIPIINHAFTECFGSSFQ